MDSFFSKAYYAKWALLGIVLAALVLWIALPFMSPIVFALFIYYVMRPVKRRLQPYIRNESLLALLCLLLLALPLTLIAAYTFVVVLGQVGQLLGSIGLQSIPLGPFVNVASLVPIAQELSPENLRYEDIAAYLSGISGQLQNYSGAVLGLKDVLLSLGLTLVDLALKLTVMLVIAFLLLVADDEFSGWFRAKFPRLMRERNGVLPRYVKAVDGDFEAIFFGNMLSVILFAFIAAAVYSVLNVFAPHPAFLIPYPLLLGVLCGLFAFLPVLGPWMIDVPILLYVAARSIMMGAFDDYAWYLVAMALAIFIFVENLPGYLLRPIVSHGNVNVVLLMLAYIVGPVIFGFPGLFIGAIVLVLVTHYFNIVLPELSEDLVEKQGRTGVSRRHRRTSGR